MRWENELCIWEWICICTLILDRYILYTHSFSSWSYILRCLITTNCIIRHRKLRISQVRKLRISKVENELCIWEWICICTLILDRYILYTHSFSSWSYILRCLIPTCCIIRHRKLRISQVRKNKNGCIAHFAKIIIYKKKSHLLDHCVCVLT